MDEETGDAGYGSSPGPGGPEVEELGVPVAVVVVPNVANTNWTWICEVGESAIGKRRRSVDVAEQVGWVQ